MMDSNFAILFGLAAVLPPVALLFLIGRGVLAGRSGASLIVLGGLAILFIGERWFGEGSLRAPLSGLGVAVLLAAVGLRAAGFQRAGPDRAQPMRIAMGLELLVLMGVGAYALTLPMTTESLGLDEAGLERWTATWSTLWPIAVLVGLAPAMWIDRTLADHPTLLPAGAAQAALTNGLSVALAIAVVFPLNYLADAYNIKKDVAYFRTTRPGTATVSMLQGLSEPVEVVLFFPAGNDVGREVRTYFDDLDAALGDRLTVRLTDQALDPATAEKLKVRDNGDVAFLMGEKNQRFRMGLELSKAKKDLKRLDQLVQTNLLKLSKGQRTAYFLAGHGEASSKEKENPLRKLNLFKKAVLEAQHIKVANLGVTEGSAIAVPDDAGLVVIAAPEKPLLPEEVASLEAYWDRGGRLFILLEPGEGTLDPILSRLGVVAGAHPLAHADKYIQQTRGPADRVNLVTNKFGSHESVKTLSKNSTQLYVVAPTAVSVEKAPGTTNTVTTLLRTFPDTWPDADGDRVAGEGESKKVWELGQAVAMGDEKTGSRAVVLGDASVLSDPILESLGGNQQLAMDVTRWLVGDDDIEGTTESEEDVRVQHTREEDVWWFWFTVAGVPVLVLALGGLSLMLRGRRS